MVPENAPRAGSSITFFHYIESLIAQISDPAQSKKSSIAGGFQAARVSHVQQLWQLQSQDDVFDVILKSSVRAAATLQAQTDEALQVIRRTAKETIRDYQTGDTYEVPMPAVLSVATKSVE